MSVEEVINEFDRLRMRCDVVEEEEQGLGHVMRDCPNQQMVTLVEEDAEAAPKYDSDGDELVYEDEEQMARILELKRRYFEDYYSDNQYVVSIKEDTAYLCLYSPKTTKETSSIRRIQRRPIRRIGDIEGEYSGRYQAWSLLQETPNTPYPIHWIRHQVDDDFHDLRSVENEFPAIVIDDTFASQDTLPYESNIELLITKTCSKESLKSELKRIRYDFYEPLAILLEEIRIDDKLNFVEESVEIMDREVKQLKQIRIPNFKVRWNSRRGPEFTWEREDQFRKKYPHLFTQTAPSSSVAS
ncbi:hypothetical protein Tco_0804641 [Tanacetum coccineum]|uniref:Reverse transcriptase domain-containing protein n=1 Tax=Tanacetum coccineum TaxID=301880 RepID=A0ABQ5A984_9ASTR